MNRPGHQVRRVVLGIVLALAVIAALRLVDHGEFTRALSQRDWNESRLLAFGLVILGAALAGVMKLHPLVTGTSSLVLAVLYGGALVTQSFTWQTIPGVPAFNQAVVHTLSSSSTFVVVGLLAGATVWRLVETARSAELPPSSD